MADNWYLNHYRCVCGKEWADEWSCACNDRCPSCNKEMEPYKSDDLTKKEGPKGEPQDTKEMPPIMDGARMRIKAPVLVMTDKPRFFTGVEVSILGRKDDPARIGLEVVFCAVPDSGGTGFDPVATFRGDVWDVFMVFKTFFLQLGDYIASATMALEPEKANTLCDLIEKGLREGDLSWGGHERRN